MIKEENGELARTLLLLLFTTGDEGDIGIRRLDVVGEAAGELSHEDEDELGIRHMDVVGEAAGEEEEERDGSEMWECFNCRQRWLGAGKISGRGGGVGGRGIVASRRGCSVL